MCIQHFRDDIKRTGTPDNGADTIGYALYAISIGGYTIYYDFRDAEYATGAYECLDVYLTYHPTSHQFERTDITPNRWINPGTTVRNCGKMETVRRGAAKAPGDDRD